MLLPIVVNLNTGGSFRIVDADHLSASKFNLSNNNGLSTRPSIAVSGDNVYVVWQDEDAGNSEILFTRSTNAGGTFDSPVNLSNNAGSSTTAQIAVSGDNVYVVWQDLTDVAAPEILFTRSTNAGGTFDSPVNLSNNAGSSTTAQIAVSGDNVYVVWQDLTDVAAPEILFTRSTNAGGTFDSPVNLSNNAGSSTTAQIAVSGDNVYVVWTVFLDESFDVFFTRSTNAGGTFDSPVNLSNNTGLSGSQGASIATSEDDVYVVWQDDDLASSGVNFKRLLDNGENVEEPVVLLSDEAITLTKPKIIATGNEMFVVWDSFSGTEDILLKRIIDNGSALDFGNDVVNISSNSGESRRPEISTDGTSVYVTWQDDSFDVTDSEILLSAIPIGAATSGCPINMSEDSNDSEAPRISSVSNGIFVVWESMPENEIFFSSGSNLDEKSISVNTMEDDSFRWDADPVTISGSMVNNVDDDQVLIDWGDGTPEESTDISGCSWGPVEHVFGSDAVGNNTIQVFMRDGSDTLVDETSLTIAIEKHATELTLDPIASVPASDPVSVTGRLTDIDRGVGIADAILTFNGTGVVGQLDGISENDGVFSIAAASPAQVAQALTVQAIFAEDSLFLGSSSNIESFDTTASNSTEVPVLQLGETVLELDEFGFAGISLTFENITQVGSLFVSDCTALPTERFLPLADSCIAISSALEIDPDSNVHIQMPLDAEAANDDPSGDVDMFLTLPGVIRDITESRDESNHTVTGSTDTFGTFVIGFALHDDAPPNANRTQIFVGDGSEVFFRDYTNLSPAIADVNLDKISYQAGEEGVLTIVDSEKNLHSNMANSITARIVSDSDTEGIILTLEETGANTAEFTGSFSTGTELSEDVLKVEPGDDVRVIYQPSGSRVKLVLDDVIESGLVQIVDIGISKAPDEYLVIGGAIKIELVDAQKTPEGKIRITMSYANAPFDDHGLIFENDQEDLRMIQEFLPTQWEDITLKDENGNIIGVNTDPNIRTVTGETNAEGVITLGFNTGPPGGCGGGCALPGTGVVLDFVAGISNSEEPPNHSDRSSGGNGGSRSSAITPTPSGDTVERSISTQSGMVTVSFENVRGNEGQLKVNSNDLSSFEEIFDDIAFLQDNNEHGLIMLEDVIYSTAGEVYDIDASSIQFTGTVDVTIPYDETALMNPGSESNVRFLHYNERLGSWEDVTTGLDEQANTVTGTLNSLSPVTAGIVLNESAVDLDLKVDAGLSSRIDVLVPYFSISDSGTGIVSATAISNYDGSQDFIVVIQVVDNHGTVQFLEWQRGFLQANQNSTVSVSWNKMEEGEYMVQVFLLTDLENPWLLSQSEAQILVQNH